MGIGCKVDAGAVSVYQTKHGSCLLEVSKLGGIRVVSLSASVDLSKVGRTRVESIKYKELLWGWDGRLMRVL